MAATPVIPVSPDDPNWLQDSINAINAELKAGNVSLVTILTQIFALGGRIAASLL